MGWGVGWGGAITFMYPRAHNHCTLITQELHLHHGSLLGWGGVWGKGTTCASEPAKEAASIIDNGDLSGDDEPSEGTAAATSSRKRATALALWHRHHPRVQEIDRRHQCRAEGSMSAFIAVPIHHQHWQAHGHCVPRIIAISKNKWSDCVICSICAWRHAQHLQKTQRKKLFPRTQLLLHWHIVNANTCFQTNSNCFALLLGQC